MQEPLLTRNKATGELHQSNEVIEVHQVNHGIKLIEAKTYEGAVFGLGYAHGTDRLWQMNFFRAMA